LDHFPVLYQEVLDGLSPEEGQIFVDGTLGAGGHAKGLVSKLGLVGSLYAFDADESAIELAKKSLSEFSNVVYCHHNFAEMKSVLMQKKIAGVHGILLDIGVSSMQIDQAERGFSFRDENEGALDMRMNRSRGLTVAEYLKRVTKNELEQVIKDYGEERYFRRIAGAICSEREKRKIVTTKDLADIIRQAIPGPKGKIDKATRTFQALRIKINEELDVLKKVIPEAVDMLLPGGKLAIITFHSLEDRIVKWGFRELQDANKVKILTKKPLLANDEELRDNVRSRSAKLRILEKL
jgi:16S rRNA (cytosine1402-N4)-methyltransferase